MRPADYLTFYAQHFAAVEVDSTFYACPSVQTVSNWAARTPEGFTFAVKIPQSITHEKALAGCDGELTEFLKTIDILGTKLGPIVFQFPFFNKLAFQDRKTARLHYEVGGQVLGQFFTRCENDMGNHKRGQLSGGQ